MLTLPPSVRFCVALEPIDMRKQIDGLAGAARLTIGGDPLSGHVFLFSNRRRTLVKGLYWDRSGYCMWVKRLEKGTFHLPASASQGATSVGGGPRCRGAMAIAVNRGRWLGGSAMQAMVDSPWMARVGGEGAGPITGGGRGGWRAMARSGRLWGRCGQGCSCSGRRWRRAGLGLVRRRGSLGAGAR